MAHASGVHEFPHCLVPRSPAHWACMLSSASERTPCSMEPPVRVKIRRLWLPWVGGGVAAVFQGTQSRGFPVTSAATIGHAREWCQSGLALPPRAVLAILQSYRNIPYARPHPLKASRRKLSSQRHGIAARAHARVGFIARLSKVRALWRSVLHWPCFWCGVRALPADRRSLSRVSSLGGETPWKPGAVVDGTF